MEPTHALISRKLIEICVVMTMEWTSAKISAKGYNCSLSNAGGLLKTD